MARQHLLERVPAERMLDAVADVCGVQAQVPSAAELAVWARVAGVRPTDVREALWERRSLVRTWAMRGTLHLLPARDLPAYVAALRTNDRWWKGAWLRMIGFGAEELRDILDAIRDSLGPRPITRDELADRVGALVGPAARERVLSGWGEMLKPAAFEGSLVSGPPRGQNVTFVRPDRWLDTWTESAADESWRMIVRGYLRAYGPATREDFARWWGMQPAPAGRILGSLGDELVELDVEEYRALALAEDVPHLATSAHGAPLRLLPMFDPYVVGTRPRRSLVDPCHEDRVFRSAGWISPVVMIDGMAAAVWGHERHGGRIEVTVEPFRGLAAEEEKAISEEADGLGAFLDAPAGVSFTRTT